MFENSTLITRIPQWTGKVLTGTDKGTSLRHQMKGMQNGRPLKKCRNIWYTKAEIRAINTACDWAIYFGCATKLKKEKDKTNKTKQKQTLALEVAL